MRTDSVKRFNHPYRATNKPQQLTEANT